MLPNDYNNNLPNWINMLPNKFNKLPQDGGVILDETSNCIDNAIKKQQFETNQTTKEINQTIGGMTESDSKSLKKKLVDLSKMKNPKQSKVILFVITHLG
jgi:hypothetical protein